MENEKLKIYTGQANSHLDSFSGENPELTQAFMLKGIGYALLAILELFKEVQSGNNSKPT